MIRWLREIWPHDGQRADLIGQYAGVGATSKLFLADVALRGRVFSDLHAPGDTEQTFINIGRRELALEIIEQCGVDPQMLYALVPKAQPKKET